MTNKHNLKDHNSSIVAIIGWILLFCSCEIAWAKDECGKPKINKVKCDSTKFPASNSDMANIKYNVSDHLTLTSEGLTIKTSTAAEDAQGIIITNKNKMKDIDVSLIWKYGEITTGDEADIGIASNIKAGRYSDGLRAQNWGMGSASLEFKDGKINVYGYNAMGIHGWQRRIENSSNRNSSSGQVNINFSGSNSIITTHGRYGHGILGRTNTGNNDTKILGEHGKITTKGKDSDGVRGQNDGRGKQAKGNIIIELSDLNVTTQASHSHGIIAINESSGAASVSIKGSNSVNTIGDNSVGVVAQTGAGELHNLSNFPSGNATVNLKDGSITTSGNRTSSSPIKGGAHGILALTTGSGIASITQDGGDISTSGNGSHGVFSLALSSDKDNAAYVKQETGTVRTSGVDSYGLSVLAAGGTAKVEQLADAKINNTGKGADGISAIGKNGVDITVAGSITGGRFGGQSVIANKGQHGMGIHVATGEFKGLSPLEFTSNNKNIAINIGKTGVVNARSDKAIVVDGGVATITNKGTITGTVSTWNQNDIFTNNAKWEIRNFQVISDATNPDAIKRDTESVAVADFGEGDDTFVNKRNATVQLKTAGSQNEGTLNHSTIVTNKYFPDYDNPSFTTQQRSIREAGVEQAHIVNLERFENTGTITMADMDTGGTTPVAGDVMVITSSKRAATQGTSLFISNGGELHIDTVLDDGEHDLTDVLVVDSVELSNKATALVVNNADPDKGASTDINCNGEPDDGEGILLVYVRGNSDTDAFVLKNKLITGDWEYKLRRTDGKSWFLHSIPMKPKGVIHLTNTTYINDGSNGISGDLSTVPDDECQALQPVHYSYNLVSGKGDTDNVEVILNDNKVSISGSFLEHTDKKSLSIRVQSKMNDYGFSQALTIDLRNYLSISDESDSKLEEFIEEKLVDEKSVAYEPAAEESIEEKPVADESIVEESVADGTVAEETVSKGSNSVKTVSEAESGCCINNQVSPIINPIIDNNTISHIVEGGNAQDTHSKDINTAVSHNKESNNRVSSPSAIETSITDISLNSNTIDEDKARGTIIGRLSAVITGDNRNVSYRLVSGAGDTDNNKISISGNQLISTDVFDFERNSTLSIRVQAEISNGPLFEKELTIAITDTEADGCINHRIASNNQYSPLSFITSAYASNGSAVVSNISIFVWLFHCFALRFIYQSKKINRRWKRLFILGLTISLVACGSGGGQSVWQC